VLFIYGPARSRLVNCVEGTPENDPQLARAGP